MSKELATICINIPLSLSLKECRSAEPDWDSLLQIFRRLEFRNLAKKVSELARRYKKTVSTQTPGSGFAGKMVQFTLGDENEEETLGNEPHGEDGSKDIVVLNTIGDLQQIVDQYRKLGSSQPFSLLLDTGSARKNFAIKGLACALQKKTFLYSSEQSSREKEEKREKGENEEITSLRF